MIRNATQLPKQGSFFDIGSQLDEKHPLIALAEKIDWGCIEKGLSQFYSTEKGRAGKPIRLMSGLLMLKQLYDYSDEMLVSQWVMNPSFNKSSLFKVKANIARLSDPKANSYVRRLDQQ